VDVPLVLGAFVGVDEFVRAEVEEVGPDGIEDSPVGVFDDEDT
jgi:hypothetical protein